MIINPFKATQNEIKKVEEVDIKLLQRYLIDNHIESLQNENKELLEINIKKYLFDNYGLNDEIKINQIVIKIFNKMFGYDILEKFIQDEKISDIRVVKYNQIYVKKIGKWEKADLRFDSEKELYEYIKYIILKNGGSINFDSPMVILSDKKYNLRIEAGIQPVNVISPSIVIRIHRHSKNNNLESLFLIDDMMDANIYSFLNKIIIDKKNIVLSGKGGSGKTTLLRAIIDKLPDNIAISTNEETMELYIENKNIIQREILENRDESKKITLEKLTKHSLVNSNDVIVIGELKGAESSLFFDSISTGHMGISTVHSNSAVNTIDRLVTLIKRDIKNQSYKESYIEKLLSSSLDYIIFMKDYKIYEIAELSYDRVIEKVILNTLFKINEVEDKKHSYKEKE